MKIDPEKLFLEAHEAGYKAGVTYTPTPMVVVEHANPLDNKSQVVRTYAPIMDGPCGFAWVNIKPANSSFCKWLLKVAAPRYANILNIDKSDYYGGVQVWVYLFGQSCERKKAYSDAFAEVLRKAGIKKVYASSRLD
jgi:hypothetical protein